MELSVVLRPLRACVEVGVQSDAFCYDEGRSRVGSPRVIGGFCITLSPGTSKEGPHRLEQWESAAIIAEINPLRLLSLPFLTIERIV